MNTVNFETIALHSRFFVEPYLNLDHIRVKVSPSTMKRAANGRWTYGDQIPADASMQVVEIAPKMYEAHDNLRQCAYPGCVFERRVRGYCNRHKGETLKRF